MNNIECPKCHFEEHLDDAIYCQSCGIELTNYCKNQNCFANINDEPSLNALPRNAKFCPYCGGETTFFDYLHE